VTLVSQEFKRKLIIWNTLVLDRWNLFTIKLRKLIDITTDTFITANYFSTNEEVLIVREKSKEACMKILDDLIVEGDVDDDEYDTFVFDNQKYKIKTQLSVVIDYD